MKQIMIFFSVFFLFSDVYADVFHYRGKFKMDGYKKQNQCLLTVSYGGDHDLDNVNYKISADVWKIGNEKWHMSEFNVDLNSDFREVNADYFYRERDKKSCLIDGVCQWIKKPKTTYTKTKERVKFFIDGEYMDSSIKRRYLNSRKTDRLGPTKRQMRLDITLKDSGIATGYRFDIIRTVKARSGEEMKTLKTSVHRKVECLNLTLFKFEQTDPSLD